MAEVTVEPSSRWVRGLLNGTAVVDSKHAQLVWRQPRPVPSYYFPREDVRLDLPEVAAVATSDEETPALAGLVTFEWKAMDGWYEEDDEVYVHPRDPHHRVDVMHSSRHVKVEMLGETVADTHRPALLFETGLPTRYYIPHQDVRMDLLRPSATTTQCPYKGVASYHGVQVGKKLARDLVWSYRYPIPECPKIQGLLAFYDERVDAVYVDGELVPKPQTPWSRPPVIVDVE
jgi:uncharacterized protein (DUF427 family)